MLSALFYMPLSADLLEVVGLGDWTFPLAVMGFWAWVGKTVG